MNQRDQLKELTTIVADTGEVNLIQQLKPEDATTNPSLLFKAVQDDAYKAIVDAAIKEAHEHKDEHPEKSELHAIMDMLAVKFGAEILKYVSGVVSTEVDARLSFDTDATVARARYIIGLYEHFGIAKERVLIKLASTWEGLRAAEILEKEGIHCNMTLLFSMCQAVEAAHVGATLISPFVGRITDWHKAATGKTGFHVDEDPGVMSVRRIYQYYKKFGHRTIVMGASFRNKEQVLALAGCDKLTISPKLLNELAASTDEVKRILGPDAPIVPGQVDGEIAPLKYDETSFRWALNEDQCGTEKLADGIRRFAADTRKLEDLLRQRLS